jgi:Tol biopolymer transport system component
MFTGLAMLQSMHATLAMALPAGQAVSLTVSVGATPCHPEDADLAAALKPAGNTQLVTTTVNGAAASASSTACGLSANGRIVLFSSDGASLVPGDANGRPDLFVRDLVSGSTTLVSSPSEGLASTARQFSGARLLSNTRVSFRTEGLSNLGPRGLYLKDLDTGRLSLLLGAADGDASGLSADAGKLAFTSSYSGFDRRVFVRDLATGQEALASASSTASNGNGIGAAISGNGSRVVFGSNAPTLLSPRPQAAAIAATAVAAPA